jgi:hypothetical protein
MGQVCSALGICVNAPADGGTNQCNGGMGCPSGQLCQNGQCVSGCGMAGAVCQNGQVCQNGVCVTPNQCGAMNPCPMGQSCANGTCVPTPDGGSGNTDGGSTGCGGVMCQTGQICVNNQCQTVMCGAINQCPMGYQCVNGICL